MLIGLGLVAEGVSGGDSVAALIVAAIVLFAAVRLGRSNVDVLMDRAPTGIRGRVERAVRSVPGVSDVRSVRVREAAGESFAEVVIGVPRLEGLERSHRTMDMVEDAVSRELGRAQVAVHAEPATAGERANDRIAAAALRVPGVVETHNITVLQDAGGSAVTLHVRLPEDMPLGEARRTVDRAEAGDPAGDRRRPGVRPCRALAAGRAARPPAHRRRGRRVAAAREAVRGVAGDRHEVVVYRQGDRLLVVTSVTADPLLSVREAHALASRVEDVVRDAWRASTTSSSRSPDASAAEERRGPIGRWVGAPAARLEGRASLFR